MTQTRDCSFLVSQKKDPMDYTLQAAEIWGAARVEFGPNKKAGFKKKRFVFGSPAAHQQESIFIGGR